MTSFTRIRDISHNVLLINDFLIVSFIIVTQRKLEEFTSV